jgi:hypothetical protein
MCLCAEICQREADGGCVARRAAHVLEDRKMKACRNVYFERGNELHQEAQKSQADLTEVSLTPVQA